MSATDKTGAPRAGSRLVAAFKRLVEPLANLKKRWAPMRRFVDWLPGWLTANRVTVGRSLLVIPVILMAKAGAYWAALIVFGLAMLLDALDGAIAEVRGQHSTLGAFLDPLADKLLVCLTLLTLLGPLPWVFCLPVTGVCLFAIGLTLVRVVKLLKFWTWWKKATSENGGGRTDGSAPGAAGAPIAAKLAGKAKCWSEVGSIIIVLIGLGSASPGLVWIGFGLLALATVLGGASFWSQLKDLFGRK